MIDPLTGIEGKKWLSKAERGAIKSLKPYQGGDDAIWPLHQLDIRRKHYRLVYALPSSDGSLWKGPKGRMFVIGSRQIERLENKTILHRFVARFDVSERDAQIAAFVVFKEPEIGLVDQEVSEMLARSGYQFSHVSL